MIISLLQSVAWGSFTLSHLWPITYSIYQWEKILATLEKSEAKKQEFFHRGNETAASLVGGGGGIPTTLKNATSQTDMKRWDGPLLPVSIFISHPVVLLSFAEKILTGCMITRRNWLVGNRAFIDLMCNLKPFNRRFNLSVYYIFFSRPIFFSDPVVHEWICYHMRANRLINESNMTGWPGNIWTG